MSKPSDLRIAINRYAWPEHGPLYPARDAMYFLETISPEFTAEDRCQILQHALAAVIKRLEAVESRVPEPEFTSRDVHKLRKLTGCTLGTCYRTLVKHKGDQAAAAEWLRNQGLADRVQKFSPNQPEDLGFVY